MKNNKTNTFRLTTTALVTLAVVVSSCGSTSNSAAEIAGTEISRDELELTITELSDVGQTPVVDGEVAGDTARSILTALIQGAGAKQLLKKYGQEITEADREEDENHDARHPAASQRLAPRALVDRAARFPAGQAFFH